MNALENYRFRFWFQNILLIIQISNSKNHKITIAIAFHNDRGLDLSDECSLNY